MNRRNGSGRAAPVVRRRPVGAATAAAALVGAGLLFGAGPARAIDHDNLDGGRPLRVEDADAIAYRERALEFGIAAGFPYRSRGGSLGAEFSLEYLYGFALNSHYSVDLDPSFGGRSLSDEGGRFDLGNVGLGVFHNFNRETLSRPAFAVRADAYLPTGRDARGLGFRLRGIMSRTFQQYNRFHVNVDANFATDPEEGTRSFQPAVTVGVSRPVGYPTRFDRTVVAELGVRASEEEGQGAVFYTGVGLRQQVSVRSVFDVGITSDFAATRSGASRDNLRLVAGYSTQF